MRRTLLGCVCLVAAACSSNHVSGKPTEEAARAAVSLAELADVAKPRPVTAGAGFIAVVSSRFEVDVATNVGGRIVELPIPLGGAVASGEPIAFLDDPDLRLAAEVAGSNVRVARSELAGARNARKHSHARLQQSRDLGEHIAASERQQHHHEFERSSARTSGAVAEVQISRIEAERLRARLDAMTLRAPFAGEVAAVYHSPGQLVGSGDVIVRLLSAARIVRFAADADVIQELAVGAPIEFATGTGPLRWSGAVSAVAPEIDSAQMVVVEATLEVSRGTPSPLPPLGSDGRVWLSPGR